MPPSGLISRQEIPIFNRSQKFQHANGWTGYGQAASAGLQYHLCVGLSKLAADAGDVDDAGLAGRHEGYARLREDEGTCKHQGALVKAFQWREENACHL